VVTKLHCALLQLQLQPFNGLFSRTTWVSRYQKGKTNLDFTGAKDSEWQWLQTDNHASTSTTLFFTGRMPFLPPNQQRQSTEGTLHGALHGFKFQEIYSMIC